MSAELLSELHEDDALVNRAILRQAQGDWAGAVTDLTAAIDAGRADSATYLMRARAHARLGKAAVGQEDRDVGLRLTPATEKGWVTRGVARGDDDPAGALSDFDAALRINPGSRTALQNKAHLLSEKLGRPADAIEALDRLLEAHPDHVPARSARGVLHARLGDRARATADAEAALARDRSPRTTYQVAGVYALTSQKYAADKSDALRLLAEALRGGYGLQHIPTDPDMAPLRQDAEFERVVAAARERAARSS